MPPIKLSDRERNLGIITVGFLVFYLFYQFLITPQLDQIPRLKDKARQARMDLKVSESKVKIMEALQKQLGVSIEKHTLTSKEEQALEVLRSIARATSNSRLNLISIRPIASEGEGLKFELSCSGSYQQMYDFLKTINTLKTVVMIDNLNVSGGGEPIPNLSLKISLTAYF